MNRIIPVETKVKVMQESLYLKNLTTVTKKQESHPTEAFSRFRGKVTSSEYGNIHGQGRG